MRKSKAGLILRLTAIRGVCFVVLLDSEAVSKFRSGLRLETLTSMRRVSAATSTDVPILKSEAAHECHHCPNTTRDT